MARHEQYMGLNHKALKFLDENKAKEIGQYKMIATVYSNDFIYGSIYEIINNSEQGFNYADTYIEVIDFEPWSSGPMYFIALFNMTTRQVEFRWTNKELSVYGEKREDI